MPTDPISITRRTLFTVGGLVASSFALPKVPGQEGKCRLVGATPAAAEEKTDTFVVDIASESTMQIKVFDVAAAGMDATSPGVAGATVTVTPLDVSEPATTLVTNENGFAVIDLKGYCKEVGKVVPRYTCEVMIDIYLEGHRKVKMLKMNAVGSHVYTLPVPKIEKKEKSDPYFRAIAFDGWDVQYNVSTFMYSTVFSEAIEITAQLLPEADPNSVTVEFWRWHTDNPVQANLPEFKDQKGLMRLLGKKNLGKDGSQCEDDKEFWEVKLRGLFLLDPQNVAFCSTNDRLVVRAVADGGYTYRVITYAKFKKMPYTEKQTGKLGLLPSMQKNGLSFTIPGKVPGGFGGGGKMKLDAALPKFDLIFNISPYGYGMIGYSLTAQLAGKWIGPNGQVKRIRNESFEAATRTFNEKYANKFEEVAALAGGEWAGKFLDTVKEPGAGEAMDISSLFNDEGQNEEVQRLRWKFIPKLFIQFAWQGYGDIAWNDDRVNVGLNMLIAATLSQSFSWYFMAGPFPLFITVGVDVSGGASGRVAWNFPIEDGVSISDRFANFWEDANFDRQSSQLALTAAIAASLSLGVGVMDAFCAGARGSVGISLYYGIFDGATYSQGAGAHPFTVDLTYSMSVFVQAWLFKFSITWSDKKNLVNTYEDKKKSSFRTMPSASAISSLVQDSISSGADNLEGALPEGYKLYDDGDMTLSEEDDGVIVSGFDPAQGITLEQLAAFADEAKKTGEGDTVIARSVTLGAFEGTREITKEKPSDGGTADGEGGTKLTEPTGVESIYSSETEAFSILRSFGYAEDKDEDEGISLSDLEEGDDIDSDEVVFKNILSQIADPGFTTLENSLVDRREKGGSGVSSLSDVGDDGVKCAASFILKGVYSDGRPKFARVSSVEGAADKGAAAQTTKMTMFRMASVQYGDVYRQRLVVQYKDDSGGWSTPEPVDFELQGITEDDAPITRFDLNDYDFDICEFTYTPSKDAYPNAEQAERHYVAILLLSGITDGNQTKFTMEDIATRPVTSLVIFGQRYSDTENGIGVANTVVNTDGQATWYFDPVARDAISWRTFEKVDEYGDAKYLTYSPTISARLCESASSDRANGGKACAQTLVITGGYAYRKTTSQAKNAIFAGDLASNIRIFSASMDVMSKAGWSHGEPDCDAFSNFRKVDGITLPNDAGKTTQSMSLATVKSNIAVGQNATDKWTMTAESYFGYTTDNGTGVFVVRSTREYENGSVSRKEAMEGNDNAVSTKTQVKVVMAPDSKFSRIVGWRGHDALLALQNVVENEGTSENNYADREERKELHLITLPASWEGAAQDAGLIGPEKNTPVEFIQNETGDMLIYPENSYNQYMPVVDENGNGSLEDDGTIKKKNVAPKYSIKAMNAVYDAESKKTLFSKPYTLATVDKPFDSISAAGSGDGTTDLVVCAITNAKLSQADYLLVRMPCVNSLTPQSIVVADNYVVAGQECTFRIAFRNDGNTVITGARVYLLDATDDKDTVIDGLQDIEVKINKDTVVSTSDIAPDAADGEATTEVKFDTGYEANSEHMLGKDDGRTVLAPGAAARIDVKAVIPKTWSGSRKIKVKASEISYINPITNKAATVKLVDGQASVGSDASKLTWHGGISCSDLSEDGSVTTEGFGKQGDPWIKFDTLADEGSIADLEDSNDAITRADGSTSGGDSSAGGSGSSSKSGKAGMPDTGDASGIAGVASLATAALGAGMLAYGKRRQMVAAEEAAATAAGLDVADESTADAE